jgi:predicted RNA binding protein YcfA (HicA-like mRNA interferase family)
MSRIPRVSGSDLVAALAKTGFAVIRVKGSTISSVARMGDAEKFFQISGRR